MGFLDKIFRIGKGKFSETQDLAERMKQASKNKPKVFKSVKGKSTGILDLKKSDLSRYGAGLALKFYDKSTRDKAIQIVRQHIRHNKRCDRVYFILTARSNMPPDWRTYSHFIFVMSPRYRQLLFDLGPAIDSGDENVIRGLYDMGRKQLGYGESEGVTRKKLESILHIHEMCFESEEKF